jgi:hypothetical protein
LVQKKERKFNFNTAKYIILKEHEGEDLYPDKNESKLKFSK